MNEYHIAASSDAIFFGATVVHFSMMDAEQIEELVLVAHWLFFIEIRVWILTDKGIMLFAASIVPSAFILVGFLRHNYTVFIVSVVVWLTTSEIAVVILAAIVPDKVVFLRCIAQSYPVSLSTNEEVVEFLLFICAVD